MECNNHEEQWDWQGEGYGLLKDPNFEELPECFWDVTTNQEDQSYMFEEATPVKACGDLAYYVDHIDDMSKESKEYRETSSQAKRRRMLQFDSHAMDSSFCSEEISSFQKSNEGDNSLKEVLPEVSQWISGFSDASGSSYEGLDPSSEGCLADCFNDAETHLSPDDMNFAGAADVHIDISELCNEPAEFEATVIQKTVARAPRNITFKGRKSYIRTPTKLASSIAYPFAFIKPSGAHGDVTLKDINQRIRTPPPSKSKENNEDPTSYPTSAFSGKPVVGKTKIRTEGGKGSITIMRTKG